jgi:hypothetical protein
MQAAKALEVENEKLQEKQDELTADVYLLAQENAKLKLQLDGLSKVIAGRTIKVHAYVSCPSKLTQENVWILLSLLIRMAVGTSYPAYVDTAQSGLYEFFDIILTHTVLHG